MRYGTNGCCFSVACNDRAVASFHGALDSFFSPSPGDVKAKILVCHGEADEFLSKESVEQFKSEMDTAEADYEFISYQGAFHGFSNTAADERGRKFNIPLAYNKNADRNSWNSKVWPKLTPCTSK